MASKSKKQAKETAPAASLEELKQQKIAAGLTPAQAESVARRQLLRDNPELAEAEETDSEETTTAQA